MTQTIALSLIHLAADEGKTAALEEAQDLQQALETLMECGSPYERKITGELLDTVNLAIKEILSGELVLLARKEQFS